MRGQMASDLFITGEWGSVSMHLTLCLNTGTGIQILETAHGAGVIGCPDFEAAFFATASAWYQTHGPLPVILAGMIGSTIGWKDSGYILCPAQAGDLATGLTTFHARNASINLSPGLRCHNMFGLPDVVRGEEMQVFGWLSEQDDHTQRVLCLPGRHVKWVVTQGKRIVSFFTGMNGEMEDLLLDHSLLGRGVTRDTFSQTDFEAGLAALRADPTLSLGHSLFATRSRLVLGDHNTAGAASFLSGVLIGADIRDALSAFQNRGLIDQPVIVMGHGTACDRYAHSFATFGQAIEVETRSLATFGLAAVYSAGSTISFHVDHLPRHEVG